MLLSAAYGMVLERSAAENPDPNLIHTINLKGTILHVTPAEHATYHGLAVIGLLMVVVSAFYRAGVKMQNNQRSE